MLTRAMLRLERVSAIRVGAVLLLVAVVVGLALFQKSRILTTLHGGEKVSADFQRDYRLRPYVTKVKVAGVKVGVVTGVDHEGSGITRVTMKVENGISDKLRSAPSAAVRPSTLLGGNYYVDLRPGGDPARFHGTIPSARTTTPVELDRVLEVLKPSARSSLRRTIPRLDRTLQPTTQADLEALLDAAPASLRPTTQVLRGLSGTRPSQDLTTVVRDLGGAARALTENHGELERALDGLDATSTVLDREKRPLSQAIALMPSTLSNARAGLNSLDGSLEQLRSTARSARPTARKLDSLLAKLQPALVAARPVVHDLAPTLADLRPVVQDLVPTAALANGVLDDVNGGPLQRVNGPIMHTLYSPFKGTGQYAGGGSSRPFYQELAYLVAGMDNSARMTDRNGSTIHFQPGFGIGSVSGLPISMEQLMKALIYPGGAE